MMTPEEFFAGHDFGLSVFRKVSLLVKDFDDVSVRTSKSQVAFRRKRGFAYLWLPGQYLTKPSAEVVLSIALGRHDDSSRFKQVVQPAPNQWMHHLEIHELSQIDDGVAAWLREAAERAS
ncbi:MAG TPA: DUF5655 domain-containing protein [Chloroflexota bacterium]